MFRKGLSAGNSKNIFVEDTRDRLFTVDAVRDAFIIRFKPGSLHEGRGLWRTRAGVEGALGTSPGSSSPVGNREEITRFQSESPGPGRDFVGQSAEHGGTLRSCVPPTVIVTSSIPGSCSEFYRSSTASEEAIDAVSC